MRDDKKIVTRPVGGRGLKAQYPTTTVRVPEVLKQSIQDIVYRFYSYDNNSDNSSYINAEKSASKKLIDIQDYITNFKNENKVTKSKLKLHELITVVESILNDD